MLTNSDFSAGKLFKSSRLNIVLGFRSGGVRCMDKKLKSLFYNHLVKMVNKGTKINSGLRPFYVQHGSKDEVWKNLRVKESHNFQKKLDQLFPEEFTVVAGFLLFSEH